MCVQGPGRAHRDGVPGAGRRLVALGRGLRPLNRPQLLRRRSHGDLRNAPRVGASNRLLPVVGYTVSTGGNPRNNKTTTTSGVVGRLLKSTTPVLQCSHALRAS